MIQVEIDAIKNNKTILYYIVSSSLKRYFLHNKFIVKYDFQINDVPESILICPALGYLLPLAFATGQEIYTHTLDKEFYKSAQTLRFIVKTLYPELPADKVKINVKELRNNNFVYNRRAALFFSGGVDSTSLLLSHINEKPMLITIWGSDIRLNEEEKWRKVLSYVKLVANKFDLKYTTIVFNDILDQSLLTSNFIRKLKGRRWWVGLASGITLPTLASPLVKLNIKRLYVASGVPKRVIHPWSDSHVVLNSIQISSMKIICDDYELSRYQKILNIKNNLDKVKCKSFTLKIRACSKSTRLWNCNYCEKCARTIIMFMLAGLDPNEFGFNIDIKKYLKYLKESLDKSWLKLTPEELLFWLDIKNLSKYHPHMRFLSSYNYENFVNMKKEMLLADAFRLINRIFGINSIIARKVINKFQSFFNMRINIKKI
ncbi:MAG: hypothetical protein QW487_07570 [Candidatus Bathyarchaeia archaeon]|nr:hypothetical protein [Candidatus Bathyarchaeota archaeon]